MAAIVRKKDEAVLKEKSLEEQLKFQKQVNYITNKIHGARDTTDILINLQSEILGLFDVDRMTIYVIDGAKKEVVSKVKTGDEIDEIRVPISNASIAGHCAASGKVVIIINAYDDKELKKIHPQLKSPKNWDEKTGIKTTQVLACPITHDKYLLGVVQLVNKKDDTQFTPEDITSAQEIARVLGVAIFNNQKAAQKKRLSRPRLT